MEQSQDLPSDGTIQSIDPGSWSAPNAFLAPSDGFVFGTIAGPANYPSGGCICWAYIQTQGVTLQSQGGNVGYFGPSWDDCMANNPQSIMMPVAGGTYFYLAVQQDTGGCNQTDASYAFYYMAAGGGSAKAEAVAATDAPAPVEVPQVGDKMRRDPGSPERFLKLLETLLPQPIEAGTRKELLDTLRQM